MFYFYKLWDLYFFIVGINSQFKCNFIVFEIGTIAIRA